MSGLQTVLNNDQLIINCCH